MTIYDIFCPVPFLPPPFGFRWVNLGREWTEKLGGSFGLMIQTPSVSAPLNCFVPSHFTRTRL